MTVAQKLGKLLQAHYFSYSSQYEFIHFCAEKVKFFIVSECEYEKRFSVMVDATVYVLYMEHSTFILRYLTYASHECKIQERFYSFIHDNGKAGKEISSTLLDFLQ